MVKNLPAIQETHPGLIPGSGKSSGQTATYSSILAWRHPWTEEPGGLQSTGLQKWDTTERLTLSVSEDSSAMMKKH